MQVVTIVRLRRFSLSESERLVYIPYTLRRKAQSASFNETPKWCRVHEINTCWLQHRLWAAASLMDPMFNFGEQDAIASVYRKEMVAEDVRV